MLSWETLQSFGPWAVAMFVLGLWLKREIDKSDRMTEDNRELRDKLEVLAEKGQALGLETKQQVAALTTILTAGGRT